MLQDLFICVYILAACFSDIYEFLCVVFYLLHSHDDALVGGGQIIFLLQHYVWYPEKDDESQSQGHAAPKKLLYDEIV